jgi:Zn-dependent M28 family amino/carboxypeptidase
VGCLARDLDPAWLEDYERQVVRTIAGEDEIAPGLTIKNRATTENREATRVYLMNELTSLGYAPERHVYESGTNVFARLGNGGSGHPLVLMGAHYDGVLAGPAAADDGTGVALVLAAARWFKDVDCRETDVIFAFFDQEENGLIGSNFFADKLKTAGEQLVAAHIFDMISFDGDHDRAIELWEPSAGLADLYTSAATSLGLPASETPPIEAVAHFSSSDHQSFLDAHLPATGVSEEFANGDHTPTYHTMNDTYANVDFDYLRLVSRVAFAAVSTQAAPNAP